VASLPAVTAFAFHIQETYNGLLELTQENKALEAAAEEDVDEGERDRLDEEIAKAEYVLRELLRIALHLDYTDEIGRRKSFAVVRKWLFGFHSQVRCSAHGYM
jgi:condensin complex subunit 3